MTKVKLCGLSRVEDIAAANLIQPDYIGFINRFPKSHRNISFEQALMLKSMLDPGIPAVGVFVDQPSKELMPYILANVIDAVQLHGHEDEAYIRSLRQITPAHIPIFKAFQIRSKEDLDQAAASPADFVLLDNGYGTGETFDWTLLRDFDRPYFLAGGLGPDNVVEAVQRFHPYAVDISSGVETDKVKDPDKMKQCVELVRGLPESGQ
ncbi:MAG: phosphoribosylanthranilate isomerase [Clostridia bacterium]|nr:phosphoribosylanthranilate isomerase [Clostridia bacterium]